jgi:hypothetical protein
MRRIACGAFHQSGWPKAHVNLVADTTAVQVLHARRACDAGRPSSTDDNHVQSHCTRCLCLPAVRSDEGDSQSRLAEDLRRSHMDRVERPHGMGENAEARCSQYLVGHGHEPASLLVRAQSSQQAIVRSVCQRTLIAPPSQGRANLDSEQKGRHHAVRAEQPLHGAAAVLGHVSLHERAGVEVRVGLRLRRAHGDPRSPPCSIRHEFEPEDTSPGGEARLPG